MSQITTHILDTSRGRPAADISVSLFQHNAGLHKNPSEDSSGNVWTILGAGTTDSDGRVANFILQDVKLRGGLYKLRFETLPYYRNLGLDTFYPWVEIVFEITADGQHYHVPLLLNPFGYSTYRGS